MSKSLLPATGRHDVWLAMAEHFLDTETRAAIPMTALTCVEAGLDSRIAFDVWRFEVTPVVWRNVGCSGGEWSAWDPTWLCEEIARRRVPQSNLARALAHLIYRYRIDGVHKVWLAIRSCIDLLQEYPPAERRIVTEQMTWLVRAYIYSPEPASPPGRLKTLRRLFETWIRPFLSSLAATELNAAQTSERVLRALAQADASE